MSGAAILTVAHGGLVIYIQPDCFGMNSAHYHSNTLSPCNITYYVHDLSSSEKKANIVFVLIAAHVPISAHP